MPNRTELVRPRRVAHLAIASAALTFAVVSGWPAPAHAQSIKVLSLSCKPGQTGSRAPSYFVAELQTDVGEAKPSQFELRQPAGGAKVAAERLVSHRDGGSPITMVVLVQGDEFWMGNETFATNPLDLLAGAFTHLSGAINALIVDAPRGSQGSLIVYGGAAPKIASPMGPLDRLATKLGSQKDYHNVVGVPLLPGLAAAVVALSARSGRRILVIIGNGAAQRANLAAEIRAMKRELQRKRIETFVLHYTTDREDELARKDRLFSLASDPRNRFQAASAGSFAVLAKQMQQRIANRVYAYFPTTGFLLDGQRHAVQVRFADEAPEEQTVVFCPPQAQAKPPARPPAVQPPTKQRGCSCSAQGHPSAAWLVGVLIALFALRRRPTNSES